MDRQTFGVIVTTRSFFPSHVVATARSQITGLLEELGYGCVMLGEADTEYGAVVTYQQAKLCADLFRRHAGEISGIICVLPNFGEELGVVEAIQQAGLDVPVLVQACDDDFDALDMANRRDAFCGKISVCNNLYQRNIPFSTTTRHSCALDSPEFRADLERFAAVCRVVTGLRGSRIAMLGSRPVAFNTVRFSEKILQNHNISVQTVDLSEILADAAGFDDQNRVQDRMDEISRYAKVPADTDIQTMERLARLGIALEDKVETLDCQASTVQCWDSLEINYGCAACLAMSMMGEGGRPSACESDVMGAVSMLAAQLAAQSPPALLDWNNNIRDDRDACINLHCSNFPKGFFGTGIQLGTLDVLGSVLGQHRTFGACKGQVKSGDMTFVRLTTDDRKGKMKAYIGEGVFEDEPIPTKGGIAACRVENLQQLLKYICTNGFEHHVCMVRSHVAAVLHEAFHTYMGIEVYWHANNK